MAEEKAGSFHYGGQAVIEGVMMRGKKHFAVACRRADGTIETTAEPVERGILGSLKWLNKPFLRGTFTLIDSLVLGMKSLMWAANIAMADEQKKLDDAKAKKLAEKAPDGVDTAPPSDAEQKKGKTTGVTDIALGFTMFLSIGFAVLLFAFAPIFVANRVLIHQPQHNIWRSVMEGGMKLILLFLYIWGISHLKDIKRLFRYHGGEHKVINAFEAGDELTVENVQKHTTVHVRCGTSFLLVVILVSVIVYMFVLSTNVAVRLGAHLVLLPLVAGIAYEVIRLAGNRKESRFMRMLLAPGLLMQRITTQEPTDDIVEVAIRSFQSVREAEAIADVEARTVSVS